MSTAMVMPERQVMATLKLLLALTRPRVLLLVVFTGLPALFMGPKTPGFLQGLMILLGTSLTGAACSAFNAFIEKDSDAEMARTRNRPLPSASLPPSAALVFGMLMTAISTLILYAYGNLLAAGVGVGSILFYVFIYTLWLKPRTAQNIVIGGAAGATAPLIADAAVNGFIGIGGWALFLIIFLWTPPHFWAIALFRKEEYARARFPMMPLVVGDQGTRWRMLAYMVVLLPVSMAPALGQGPLGILYMTAALGAGVWFFASGVSLLKRRDDATARKVFRVSVQYLFILFGAMLVDLALRGAGQ